MVNGEKPNLEFWSTSTSPNILTPCQPRDYIPLLRIFQLSSNSCSNMRLTPSSARLQKFGCDFQLLFAMLSLPSQVTENFALHAIDTPLFSTCSQHQLIKLDFTKISLATHSQDKIWIKYSLCRHIHISFRPIAPCQGVIFGSRVSIVMKCRQRYHKFFDDL
jgi:hypothetical protein